MAMVNIRIDDTLKAEADKVFSKLNISATEAITRLYRYAAQHRQLPFNDPRMVLRQMRDAVGAAADVALSINVNHSSNGLITVTERDAASKVLDATVRSLEDNYSALTSACGGSLPHAFLDAANAMKGILYMTALCITPAPGGLRVNAELDEALSALSNSFNGISLVTDRFDPRE